MWPRVRKGLQIVQRGVRGCSYRAENFEFVEFRNLTQWSDIETAIASVGDNLSAAHIGAAFAQSQKLLPRPPPSFLQSLTQRTLDQRHVLDMKSVITIVHACAGLGHFDPELLAALEKVTREQVLFMDFHTTAKLIYTLGRLQQSWQAYSAAAAVPFAQMESMLQVLTSRLPTFFQAESGHTFSHSFICGRCCRRCETRSTVLLMLGLAELEYWPPDLSPVVARHLTLLTDHTPESLATILYALSRLRCRDVPLIQRLAREVTSPSHLSRLTGRELATVIYALERLGIRSHIVLSKLIDEASKTKRLRSFTDHSLANILHALSLSDLRPDTMSVFQEAFLQDDRLQTCREQDIVSLMHSLRRRPRFDDHFMKMLMKTVTERHRLEQWTPSDVIEILFGFAVCSCPDPAPLEPLVEKLRSVEVLKPLLSHQIADAVYSVGILALPMPKALCAHLQNISWLQSLSQVSILRVVTGLSRGSPQLPALNQICAQAALTPRRLGLYASKELTQLTTAFTVMGLRSRVFVRPLEMAITKDERFRRCEVTELAALTIALSELRRRDSPCLTTLYEHLMAKANLQRLPLKTVCRLLTCAGRLDLQDAKWAEGVAEVLRQESKVHLVETHIVPIVTSLCHMQLSSDLWSFLLPKLKNHLLANYCPLHLHLQLLNSVAGNVSNLRRELKASGIVELILKQQSPEVIEELSDEALASLATSFAALLYPMPSWINAICDQALDRISERDLRDKDLIRCVAALMETCAQLKVTHEPLLSSVALHVTELHETIKSDRTFCVEPYASHELLVNFLRLKGVEGDLTPKHLASGLDLMVALERESVAAPKSCLPSVFHCLLYLQRFGYRPETNQQSRLLRRSMEAQIEEQIAATTAFEKRVKGDTELAASIMEMKLRPGAMLRDLHLKVDLLDRYNKTVALFLEPGAGLDFDGMIETGDVRIKRTLMEHRGYHVRPHRTPRSKQRTESCALSGGDHQCRGLRSDVSG